MAQSVHMGTTLLFINTLLLTGPCNCNGMYFMSLFIRSVLAYDLKIKHVIFTKRIIGDIVPLEIRQRKVQSTILSAC